MSMQAIIAKIRALRALSESANIHEAAAAAAAAERLIQEHSLQEADMQAGAGGEDEPVTHAEVAVMPGERLATWQSELLVKLASNYQCSGFFRHGYSETHKSPAQKFIAYGRAQDIEMLTYQFAWFTSEIVRLAGRLAQGRGRTYANSFKLGAVAAVCESLREARQAARKGATSQALAVVDKRTELSKILRDAENPDLVSRKRKLTTDQEGYEAGKRAAALLNQRTQMGGAGGSAAAGPRLLGPGSVKGGA